MSRTFDSVKDIPTLDGKVIVITGGNAGLGAETARKLAAKNPKMIFLCCRSPSKAQDFIDEVVKETSSTTILKSIELDLSSLKSVQSAALEISKQTNQIDILYLHAGVSNTAPGLTKDGYETQFGVNYLSHAFFCQALLPILLETSKLEKSDVRIISTSSESAMIFAPKQGILLDDIETKMENMSTMARYGQSKLAQILFTRKLAQLYPSIKSISIHPGLVKTENRSKGDGAGLVFGSIWSGLLFFTGVTVEQGAKNQLWAAVSKDAVSGAFYLPIGKEEDGGKFGRDRNKIDELWSFTERALTAHGGQGWPLFSP